MAALLSDAIEEAIWHVAGTDAKHGQARELPGRPAGRA